MNSFIVKLGDFFKLNNNDNNNSFDTTKRKLLIPLYQREYKWTDEKIDALINDINLRDKFLGIVILDATKDSYEIVDGQQRITTCFLTLLCLYNLYSGKPLEQQSLLRFIKPFDNCFILANDSVGSYIIESGNNMTISISDEYDVYYQKEDFIRSYNKIYSVLSAFQNQNLVREFKRKFLDCELLILINEQHNNTRPIEQVFLDINEKSQLLEAEDIFKGHCFENYEEEYHSELRNTWTKLKRCGMEFKRFGFKDVSQYLYLFLLEKENRNIPENLSPEGKHYLDGKTMDETETILSDMIMYGENVVNHYSNLLKSDYRFDDLCPNSFEYRNTTDHEMLKIMSIDMLNFQNAQYQKLPLMFLLFQLSKNEDLRTSITHDEFRKIITNLYIYTSIFTFSGGRKSKQDVDHSIRDALLTSPTTATSLIAAAKELRKTKVNQLFFSKNLKFESLSFVYSIIDNYVSNENWLPKKYSRETGFNLEHFIIPDNRQRKVSWSDGKNNVDFILPPNIVTNYKNKTINFLVINKDLNGILEHYDIETKICLIRERYKSHATNIPEHIELYIQYIESMPEYTALKDLKGTEECRELIENNYITFLEAYFKEENQQKLLSIVQERFKSAFQN